jgi:hypothetical protein
MAQKARHPCAARSVIDTMNEIISTQSVTVIVDGVEYSTYSPPDCLIKVMKRCFAERLLSEGAIHFGCLDYYRRCEDAVLGDPNDGEGMLRMNAHPYKFGSINPVYAWCSALLTITPERINLLAEHGNYDCLVRIHQPQILIQRVQLAKPEYFHLHYAEVSYDRGAEVDKVTLNSQKFQFYVFQKDPRFIDDQEYRISLTNISRSPDPVSHIDLSIGKCSDIMVIEDLPNIGVQWTAQEPRCP